MAYLPTAAPPVRQHTRPPAHAPAPALTHSYSPSPPHPLSPLPSSGPVHPPLSFPIPYVPGGYSASGLVRQPSPPMTERATTTYEYNVQNPPFTGTGRRRPSRRHTSQAQEQAPPPGLPCNVCQLWTPSDEHARLGGFCSERHRWEWNSRRNQIQSWQDQNQAQQNQNSSSQSDSRMSGGTQSVTGDQSHDSDDRSNSHNQDLEQRLEPAGNSSDYGQEKEPPTGPGAGRPDVPCRHCRRMTPYTVYDRLGGFCKQKHRKEWYAS